MDLATFTQGHRSRKAAAAALGCHPQQIYDWTVGGRPVPEHRCPTLERVSGGALTCEELRADIHWRRVPDKAWPHRRGRPLVDYSEAA